jgi:tRNA A37 threonylcarbamoyladenosine biosynthesis protein TsaE
MSKSQVKKTIILFLDNNGVIMIEWAHEGQTVNQNYYLEVLIKLRERLWEKRQELRNKK